MGIKYPQHLLPNRRYKFITLDEWMKQMFVIRYTDGGIQIPDSQTLQNSYAAHFKESHWYQGISVSLCGPFKKKDTAYIIKPYKIKRFSKPWKQGKGVRIPKQKHVELNPTRGYLGMKIGKLQEVSFSYTFDYLDGKIKKTRTDQCHLVLEHAPTQSNFWHFNIWIESHNTVDNVVFTTMVAPNCLPSKKNMEKRAQAVIELLKDIVCISDATIEITLPHQYYVR